MTESNDPDPGRLDEMAADIGELKGALVHVTGILTDQSERLGGMQRTIGGMQMSIHDVQHGVAALQHSVDSSRSAVEARLDRLLALTVEERTVHYERLREIERRLAALEERVGSR